MAIERGPLEGTENVIPLLTPVEQQRLDQFQHIRDTSNVTEDFLNDNDGPVYLTKPISESKKGTTQKAEVIITLNRESVYTMRKMAFHMYDSYFRNNPRLEGVLADTRKEREINQSYAERDTLEKLNAMWDNPSIDTSFRG